MKENIDYPRELRKLLTERPFCSLELARLISKKYDLEIGDVRLRVLLELRNMTNSGEVETIEKDSHERYVIQSFPD